ncbi:MAG: hypothetical protein K6C94_02035 [Candidatus Gastranaerophilales bacterium]|nr:hypothetical protein [Candidatus Gastranaerophilales bacterium]
MKKSDICDKKELLKRLSDELKYEVRLENTRYFWLKEYLDDEDFYKDLSLWVQRYLQAIKQKQCQAQYTEKRKMYLKTVRKNLLKNRQSHEKPTAKQIKYYNYLCEKYGIAAENTEDKSKLDLINLINGIINERSAEIQSNIQGNI